MKLNKQTVTIIALAAVTLVSVLGEIYIYQTTQATARVTAATISEQQEEIDELNAALDKQAEKIETLKIDLEAAKLEAANKVSPVSNTYINPSSSPSPSASDTLTLEERLDAILAEQPSSNGGTAPATPAPSNPKTYAEYNPDEWSPRPDNPDNIDDGKMGEISGRHDNPFA